MATNRREYQNQYYADNREKRKQQILASDQRRRLAVRAWLDVYLILHPCIDCGETDPIVLEFDHVSGEKRGNIGDLWRRCNLASIQAEVAKCEVRCANCHRRKTHARLAHLARAPLL